MRFSITEHSFQGIHTSRMQLHAGGVTHVSGTFCHHVSGHSFRIRVQSQFQRRISLVAIFVRSVRPTA